MLKTAVLAAVVLVCLSLPSEARPRHRHHHRHHAHVVHGGGNVVARSGATAHVSPSARAAFQCIVDRLERQGYPVRFMGGWRAHGSVRGSLHPAGLAIDINQTARNRTTPRMPRNEIEIANSCGAISGAQWANGDSGHFQIGGWAGRGRHYARRHKPHYADASDD